MEGQSVIIIKKVKKGGHGGAHGGSWKVAYADFVTAMMAFFLLLWLISMVAPEKRARVAHYFKHFSMFDKSGDTMLDAGKITSVGALIGEDGMQKTSKEAAEEQELETEALPPSIQLQQNLIDKVEELGEWKEQVLFKAFEGGVRVELVDSESLPMFHRGRADLTAEGRRVLRVIGENLLTSGSKIAIEGHTDAFTYASKHYSNWELSTDRASAARKELELNGLPTERLLRVAGFAATEPLVREDAFDPRNRRISIVVFDPPSMVSKSPAEPLVKSGSKPNEGDRSPSPLSILEDPRFRSPAAPAGVGQPSQNAKMADPQPRSGSRPPADSYREAQDGVRKKIPLDPIQKYLFTQ